MFHTNENIQWNQWLKPFFPCTRNQWLKKVSHLTSFLHLSLDFQFFHVRLPKHNHPGQKLVRIEIQITKCKKNINDVIFPCSQGLMWKIEKRIDYTCRLLFWTRCVFSLLAWNSLNHIWWLFSILYVTICYIYMLNTI